MIWKWIARWALVAIAVPVAVAGARRVSQEIEERRGPSRGTRILRRSADTLQRVAGRKPRRRRRRW